MANWRFSLLSHRINALGLISRPIMTTPNIRASAAKAAEDLKTNPYFDKYANKIANLQQTSPEEFLSRIEARQADKDEPKFGSRDARQYSSLLEPKKQLNSDVEEVHDKRLDQIMKTDLIKDKTAEEISQIWTEYHLKKDFITATIPAQTYDKILLKGKQHPVFLFPIPRSQGYEFMVCQFLKNVVHFTTLLNYQVHKENAPECLTIAHYTEFKDGKNIVLMRGEFDTNVLNVQEAQCLANQLQLYYGQDDTARNQLLNTFTHKPDEFKHMDIIKQVETVSIN